SLTRANYGRFGEQRDGRVLALEVLQLPLGPEEQHAALLTIHRQRRLPAERRHGLRGMRHPSRDAVRRRLDLDLDSVFGAQTADDDVELTRANDSDDRPAPAGADDES